MVLIWAQNAALHRSAGAFNHHRETSAAGLNHAAEASKRDAIKFGIFAAAPALLITTSLLWRFVMVTDLEGISFYVVAAMCIAAGIGMPLYAWWAKAYDGTRISREKDELTTALDNSLATHNDLLHSIDITRTKFADTYNHLNNRVIPEISANTTKHLRDEIDRDHVFLRLQLGGLDGLPPKRTVDNTSRFIFDSGLTGAEPIHYSPLEIRQEKLDSSNREMNAAIERIAALPEHPWADPGHRTSRHPANETNPRPSLTT